jgi:hypothetical protein
MTTSEAWLRERRHFVLSDRHLSRRNCVAVRGMQAFPIGGNPRVGIENWPPAGAEIEPEIPENPEWRTKNSEN